MTGLENPRNSLYTKPATTYLARELTRAALRRFSRSSARTATNSGAVLCDQSMNPTKPTSREHPTQVVVCGSASSRRGEMVFPQVSQLRMGVPFKLLLHGAALHTGFAVLVHSSLLDDSLGPPVGLAHLLAATGDCCAFTLGFKINRV